MQKITIKLMMKVMQEHLIYQKYLLSESNETKLEYLIFIRGII